MTVPVSKHAAILIIEDVAQLADFIDQTLTKAGYDASVATTAESAYSLLRGRVFDLVLLDLRLGGEAPDTGIDILRTIRRQDAYLPVIIVSAVDDLHVKVDTFEIGCDDYITKPFAVEELLGRVRRLLKRSAVVSRSITPIEKHLESGPFVFDIAALSVKKNGELLPLRHKLFNLFLFFARYPDTILSPDYLIAADWNTPSESGENNLYVHICQLRSAIEDDPSSPRFIHTVRKAGYCYSPLGRARKS
jgi:DNA-binding response OmpR family regulator